MQNSWLKWFGGKRYLLDEILPFPEHSTYLEVFGGSGVILLNKIPAQEEYFNDINSNLINAWKTLQQTYLWFQIRGQFEVFSRQLFEEYKLPSSSKLENAFRFFYLNRMSFSGNNARLTGFDPRKAHRAHNALHSYLKEKLPQIHNRIQNVRFEQQHYKQILTRFLKNRDEKNTLIYADPPYFQGGQEYEKMVGGQEWTEEDFIQLKEILNQFEKAKIIVSIDNENYLSWNKKSFEKHNRCNIKKEISTSIRTEYLFYNYDPKTVSYMKPKNQQSLEGFF